MTAMREHVIEIEHLPNTNLPAYHCGVPNVDHPESLTHLTVYPDSPGYLAVQCLRSGDVAGARQLLDYYSWLLGKLDRLADCVEGAGS